MDNPNTAGAVFEPTNILLRDVWLRSFDSFLEEFNIPHDFRVSPQPEYIIHHPTGTTTLLCRATETWNRIRGINLSFVLADEIDTSPPDVAQKAAEMMLARLRGGSKPQLALASTPEGFKFMYRTFVQDFHDAESSEDPTALERLHRERRLIKARTTDNPHLPDGFVDSLYSNYPPQLIASYINGEFTNLANTTVYPYFDRDTHWCDTTIADEDRVFIGIDFNVGACFLEVMVRRGDEFHFVTEHNAKDTPAVVRLIQATYPEQIAAGNLVVVPDAASRQRSTSNAAESDLALLKRGGFTVKNQLSNPAVEDRVNAMNTLFINNRLRVHNKCRYLIRSLETQAYDAVGRPEKGRGTLQDKSGPVDAAGYVVHALAGLRRYTTGSSDFSVW
jgi:PBSX family phage terminase large subunit